MSLNIRYYYDCYETLPKGVGNLCRYFTLPFFYAESIKQMPLRCRYFQLINSKLGANGGVLRDGACQCNLCKLVQLSAQETDQLPRNGRAASIDRYNTSSTSAFLLYPRCFRTLPFAYASNTCVRT